MTSKNSSTLSSTQVEHIENVLIKVSNLSNIPSNVTKGYFGTINNILNAPDDSFKSIKSTSNM